jgi:hypothetical protein
MRQQHVLQMSCDNHIKNYKNKAKKLEKNVKHEQNWLYLESEKL